jgi:hypothetical protein
VCTAALHFLALENLRDANELLRKYREVWMYIYVY